jgi:hypothetical protein
VIEDDGSEGEVFEYFQLMSAAPLTVHPETGQKVVRVIGTPNAPRTWTDSQGKAKLSDKSLERMGFTKYVRGTKGYEKTLGKGPDVLKRPPKG